MEKNFEQRFEQVDKEKILEIADKVIDALGEGVLDCKPAELILAFEAAKGYIISLSQALLIGSRCKNGG